MLVLWSQAIGTASRMRVVPREVRGCSAPDLPPGTGRGEGRPAGLGELGGDALAFGLARAQRGLEMS